MTIDAIQLLRDRWSEVPDADEETVREAYAYATSSRARRWRGAIGLPYVTPLRPRFALPAAAAICALAACAVVFTGSLGGSGTERGSQRGSSGGLLGVGVPIGSISAAVDHPLAGGTQIAIAQASNTLGAPVVLPDTNLVRPSDAGPVWTRTLSNPTQTQVAVTYPAQNLIIYYRNPGYSLATYETWVQGSDTMHKISINGVPALFFDQQTSEGGANALALPTSGIDILIVGRYDEPTLENVGQSILAQSP